MIEGMTLEEQRAYQAYRSAEQHSQASESLLQATRAALDTASDNHSKAREKSQDARTAAHETHVAWRKTIAKEHGQ
jgi:hypothetical protein